VAPTRFACLEDVMGDVVYLGIAVGFFLLTWALVKLCERV
jgi:hypothetical protein